MPTRLQLDFAAAWLARDPATFPALAFDASYGYGAPLVCHKSSDDFDAAFFEGASVLAGYYLTPAGSDLLATIEALGIDPTTARADDDPVTVPQGATICETCNGTHEISIIGEFMNPCPDCEQVFGGPTPSDSPVQTKGSASYSLAEIRERASQLRPEISYNYTFINPPYRDAFDFRPAPYHRIDTGRTTCPQPETQELPRNHVARWTAEVQNFPRWTTEDKVTLAKLYERGDELTHIAARLGRTTSSIRQAGNRLPVQALINRQKSRQKSRLLAACGMPESIINAGVAVEQGRARAALQAAPVARKPDPNPPGFGED